MAKTKINLEEEEVLPQIEYRTVKELDLLHNNPRFIDEAEFEKLRKSIRDNKEYFAARPCILSDRTGMLVIIAGNQRFKAAIAEGYKKVPTILLSGLTEAKEKEIAIRDNVSNGQWDMDALKQADWADLPLGDWGVEVPEDLQFTKPEEEIKETELVPFKKTHVLLSFKPSMMLELQPILQQLADMEGVEYEQSSN